MFKKILVAEDLDSINESVNATLKEAGVKTVDHAKYCDKALLKLKRAKKSKARYGLLITDMSFKKDHVKDTIGNGEELIKMAKEFDPKLKVVVYSIEDKVAKVKRLFDKYHINGYVCKDRNGLKELMTAITLAYNGKTFASPSVASALNNNSKKTNFTDYDIVLLKLLSKGFKQGELPEELDKKKISPSSKSSVEKRLNTLKTMFGAKNAIHLIAVTKDLGVI